MSDQKPQGLGRGRGRGRRLLDTIENKQEVGGMINNANNEYKEGADRDKNMNVEKGETVLNVGLEMMGKIIGKAGSVIQGMRDGSVAGVGGGRKMFRCHQGEQGAEGQGH